MLSAAKHLALAERRPFTLFRVTRLECNVMLSAAKHLALAERRPFNLFRVTRLERNVMLSAAKHLAGRRLSRSLWVSNPPGAKAQVTGAEVWVKVAKGGTSDET